MWIQPFEFSQALPYDVDYRVMMTFLEFYESLMKFVLFKLYQNLNLVYPPTILKNITDEQNFTYSSIYHEQANNLSNLEADNEESKYQIDNSEFSQDKTLKKILKKAKKSDSLFQGMVFFLSTEVPKTAFELMILAFGGKCYTDLDNFNSTTYENPDITHVITDRPAQSLNLNSKREYIQPQWIADCINNKILLPLSEYAPGKPLPPHLSPFENYKATEGDYIPERLKELKKIKGESVDSDESSEEEEEDQEANLDDKSEEYLENEELYDTEKEVKKVKKNVKNLMKEDKNLKKMALGKKKRRILEKINYGQEKKKELVEKLKQRRKELLKNKN